MNSNNLLALKNFITKKFIVALLISVILSIKI